MKIRQIRVRGFRGFNEERELLLNERLTLVHAPNSYGKTSISEAFEWIIYGVTSKVEEADSKEEYRGSYRNVHLPDGVNPAVTMVFVDGDKEVELRQELFDDIPRRFVDGAEVKEWPFQATLVHVPRPFILQHALKSLLLATPVDRFENFARLLGFGDLGKIHKDLISFCTKPPLPEPVARLLADVRALEGRVAVRREFAQISKELRRGAGALDKAYHQIKKKCREHVPKETDDASLLPQLLKVRAKAVGKVFSGEIVGDSFTEDEQELNTSDEKLLARIISNDLIQKYSDLIKLKAIQHLTDLAQLHEIGIRLLEEDSAICPLCQQPLDRYGADHIRVRHADLSTQKHEYNNLERQKVEVEDTLEALEDRLSAYHSRLLKKTEQLLALKSVLDKLRSILTPKHAGHYDVTQSAIAVCEESAATLAERYQHVQSALLAVRKSITDSSESTKIMNDLGGAILQYLPVATAHKQAVQKYNIPLSEAAEVLKHELDILAGTQDVSVLIDLLERRGDIRKKFRIHEVLESLKGMKQAVDKFVSEIMLTAISGEFGTEVSQWYERIRTTGDPDVHFAGFDMKKTAQGGRVQIKARSYAKDLVSAVSSLSESKLNALGLCISIAINMKTPSPFEFLIIDDPIQSWDEEHETKFIEVLRELVAQGKQVVLLSHNQRWIKQVREMCSDLNGRAYEITGFTKTGPHIKDVQWADVRQRLAAIKGIMDNPSADRVLIQQGEEEVRLVLSQLAAELHLKIIGQRKNPSKLNEQETRKVLLACGIEPEFASKLVSTFSTVDDAHHAPGNYSAHRERLRTYYGWLTALEERIKQVVTR